MNGQMNRSFSKDGIQMVNKYMKESSTILAIKELHIIPTL
jgi:hypothetical protein